MIKAILFDVFGTLVQIADPHAGFRELRSALKQQGVNIDPGYFMVNDVSVQDYLQQNNITLPLEEMQSISEAFDSAMGEIKLYPGVLEAIRLLREAGYKMGVCSNLAQPYGDLVRMMLPDLDCYVFSYLEGVRKPQKAIFEIGCERLGSSPSSTLMIGNSFKSDYQGAIDSGLHAYHFTQSEWSEKDRDYETDMEYLAQRILSGKVDKNAEKGPLDCSAHPDEWESHADV